MSPIVTPSSRDALPLVAARSVGTVTLAGRRWRAERAASPPHAGHVTVGRGQVTVHERDGGCGTVRTTDDDPGAVEVRVHGRVCGAVLGDGGWTPLGAVPAPAQDRLWTPTAHQAAGGWELTTTDLFSCPDDELAPSPTPLDCPQVWRTLDAVAVVVVTGAYLDAAQRFGLVADLVDLAELVSSGGLRPSLTEIRRRETDDPDLVRWPRHGTACELAGASLLVR